MKKEEEKEMMLMKRIATNSNYSPEDERGQGNRTNYQGQEKEMEMK